MRSPNSTNRHCSALLTDLYQLTMAYGYWKAGVQSKEAVFHLFFRSHPFKGGFSVALSAVREKGGAWKHKIKLSEQVAKVSTPGLQQVRRFRRNGAFLGDMIYDLDGPAETGAVIVDRTDLTRRMHISDDVDYEDLLVPIFRSGRLVYEQPPIADIRGRAQMQLSGFHEGHKRFLNPHEYPVGLSPALHDLRTRLVFAARESAATAKTTHAP